MSYDSAMTHQGLSQHYAPDATWIEALALQTLSRLPDPFAAHLVNVVLFVEEFATDDVLAEMGIENPYDLTGLYSGRSVAQPSQTGDIPPGIHIYRRPLLDEWIETGVSLEELIAHVMIHEIGHHFGLTDEAMQTLEDMVAG
jgi:predicted Zn-dependent protease with MMP-like domain